jgi:oligopeptide/dipeptide ABC transporter ATP-binding protein
MSDAILKVSNLSIDLHTQKETTLRVVDSLSFELGSRQTLGIVGESGCGKSMTSQALMRLLPSIGEIADGGEIEFDGVNIVKCSKREMQRIRGNRMSLILQDSMTVLNPVTTIKKQMTETLLAHNKISRAEALRLSVEMLGKMGIPSPEARIRDYPHQFSGGMKQRISIAISLLCNPKLIIADEPTTALDVTIQAQILDLLKQLRRDTDTSIIIISHDLGVVSDMADFLLVMYAGQCVEYGAVDEVFANPKHPYTRGLLSSIPRMEYEVETLPVIPGQVPSPREVISGCRFHPRCEYATDKCRAEPPPLSPDDTGRKVRCWTI